MLQEQQRHSAYPMGGPTGAPVTSGAGDQYASQSQPASAAGCDMLQDYLLQQQQRQGGAVSWHMVSPTKGQGATVTSPFKLANSSANLWPPPSPATQQRQLESLLQPPSPATQQQQQQLLDQLLGQQAGGQSSITGAHGNGGVQLGGSQLGLSDMQFQDAPLGTLSPRTFQLVTSGVVPSAAGAAGSAALLTSSFNLTLQSCLQPMQPAADFDLAAADTTGLQLSSVGEHTTADLHSPPDSQQQHSGGAQGSQLGAANSGAAPGLNPALPPLSSVSQRLMMGPTHSPPPHLALPHPASGAGMAGNAQRLAHHLGGAASSRGGAARPTSSLASDSETSHMSNLPKSGGNTRATRAAQRAARFASLETPPPAAPRTRSLGGAEAGLWDTPTELVVPHPCSVSGATPGTAATPSRTCHCKKSQCLKLYCDCFAAGMWCVNCACSDCHNRPQCQALVAERREQIVQRDPKAFVRKIQVDGVGSAEKHKKGCNCKRSKCLKKYCECYQGGVRCSNICKCVDCENQDMGGGLLANSPMLPLMQGLPHGLLQQPLQRGPPTSAARRAASLPRTSSHSGNSSANNKGATTMACVLAQAAAASAAAASMLTSLGIAPHMEALEEAQEPGSAQLKAGSTGSAHVVVKQEELVMQQQPEVKQEPERTATPDPHTQELLLQAEAGWAGSVDDTQAPSPVLRQVLDGVGLLNTPPSLRPGTLGKAGPGSQSGFAVLEGEDQQLLVMQLQATPTTLRYPHSIMMQCAGGPSSMDEDPAPAGLLGGDTSSFGNAQQANQLAARASVVSAASAPAVAAEPAGPAAAAVDHLATTLQLLRGAGSSSPSQAAASAGQAGSQHEAAPGDSSQHGPALNSASYMLPSVFGGPMATSAAGKSPHGTSAAGFGDDGGEAFLRAASEELGGEEDVGDMMELGSASWRHALSRLAGTPGGVARLLASPCRSSFNLSSPLPPPDLLLPRHNTPGVGSGLTGALAWGSDLILSPDSATTLLGTNPMAAAPDPLTAALCGSGTPAGCAGVGSAAKQHQGVVGSVEALVSPVRTSRRPSTSGVKRNLGFMMGSEQVVAPSGITANNNNNNNNNNITTNAIPHSPGLDALANAAAEMGQDAAPASMGAAVPPYATRTVVTNHQGTSDAGIMGASSAQGASHHHGSVVSSFHPPAVTTGARTAVAASSDGVVGQSPLHKRTAVGAGAAPARAASVSGLREQQSSGSFPSFVGALQAGLPSINSKGPKPSAMLPLAEGGGSGNVAQNLHMSRYSGLRARAPSPAPVLAPSCAGADVGRCLHGSSNSLAGSSGMGGGVGATRCVRDTTMPAGPTLEALKAQASEYINSRCRPSQQTAAAAAGGQAPGRSSSLPAPPAAGPTSAPPSQQRGSSSMHGAGVGAGPAQQGGPLLQSQPVGAIPPSAPLSSLGRSPQPAASSGVLGVPGGSSDHAQQQQAAEAAGLHGAANSTDMHMGLGDGLEGGACTPTRAGSLPTGSSSALPMLCGTPWGDAGFDANTLDSMMMTPGTSCGFGAWESMLQSPKLMCTPLVTSRGLGSGPLFCGSPPGSKWWTGGGLGGGPSSAAAHPSLVVTSGTPPPALQTSSSSGPQGRVEGGSNQQQQSLPAASSQLLRMTPGTTLVSPSALSQQLGATGQQQHHLQMAARSGAPAAANQRVVMAPQQGQQQQQSQAGNPLSQVPA